MTLSQWRASLDEFRKVIRNGRVPLLIAMQALNTKSRASLYRRINELNAAGFWLRVNGDELIIEIWPEWIALGNISMR